MRALLDPRYWLVVGTEWTAPPGESMAEAAFAFVPSCVPPEALGQDAADVLKTSDLFAGERLTSGRVVFFSDITRALARQGYSWAAFDIDWEAAIRELSASTAPFPRMDLMLSQLAHVIVCDASVEGVTLHTTSGRSEKVTEQERQAVHDALEDHLATDWPSYIQHLIDQGMIRSG